MKTHPLRDAALTGKTSDFGAAYDRYAPVVYGLLIRILRDPGDAQEILQETFLAAWTDARKFDPARGSELAWLIAMARSRGIDRLRARQRRGQREEEARREISIVGSNVDSAGSDPVAFREIRVAVRSALQELPEAQRSALELAYFDGLSQSEIATRLGEPLGTIKTRTNLAMKKLRERLGAFKSR
ncbi:MAG TPA: sigma-70 family RNA polymerase sigma factor [Thermoanaerobaculia bacterium]|nr:sigma-70 family RNA polymerase sigma factor [Thermoanaerobaculia bacterium]